MVNKFTIIIPTMYFHNEELQKMIDVYEKLDVVYEILIVNNNRERKIDLNGLKVRIIGIGVNLYVNPSWKLGARLAKTNNLVFVNDDLMIKGNLKGLFSEISKLGLKGKIIGPSRHCFRSKESYEGFLVIKESNEGTLPHGFGVFFFMDREDYLNTKLPKGLLVWYGDMILYNIFKAYVYKGVEIVTEFAGTTKQIDLNGFARKEKFIYSKFVKENQAKWARK